MKRKKLFCLLVVCVFSLSIIQPVFAVNDLGNVTYWYSDSGSLGYYSPSSIKVFVAKTSACQAPDSTISSAASAGFNAWSSSESLTRTTGTESDYNWRCYGISRSEAQSLGIPNDAEAASGIVSSTFLGIVHYVGSTIKNIYSITQALTYLVWDNSGSGSVKTSTYSQGKWNAIAAHEFGHCAGYYGHDTTSSSSNKSLMNPYSNYYYDSWSVSTPQTRDLNHMSGY